MNKIDPSEVCTAIGMCKTKVAVPVNKVKADECALCEFVLSTLSQTLSDNATQQEIVDALEKVCTQIDPHLDKSIVQMHVVHF